MQLAINKPVKTDHQWRYTVGHAATLSVFAPISVVPPTAPW